MDSGKKSQKTGISEEDDLHSVADHAGRHTAFSGDKQLYTRVVNSLMKFKQNMVDRDHEFDEKEVAESYKEFFSPAPLSSGSGGYSSDSNDASMESELTPSEQKSTTTEKKATSNSMASAAALYALKMLTGLQSENSIVTCSSPITPQGSSNNRNAFVGIAMAEASRLFDTQKEGGKLAADADKEIAVREAGKIALKMYLRSHSARNGPGSGGGLMALASRFL